jgi:hypothetical protein
LWALAEDLHEWPTGTGARGAPIACQRPCTDGEWRTYIRGLPGDGSVELVSIDADELAVYALAIIDEAAASTTTVASIDASSSDYEHA